MAPKRSHAEMLGTETPADLRILVTDGQPLMAHREVLRLFSSCVRGLPDGMDWDLKAVQLDGRAVSRDTVSAWVDAVYARIDCSFQARTMHLPQLLQVYNFAEFVGSSSGVMQALADKVCGDNTLLNYIGAVSAVSPNIPCHVTLDMRQIAFYESSDCLYLYDRRFNFREGHHMSTFTDALIAALEEVLYSAVKHEFRQLEKKVNHFVRQQCDYGLWMAPNLDRVYSSRVLSCISEKRLRAAWVMRVLKDVDSDDDTGEEEQQQDTQDAADGIDEPAEPWWSGSDSDDGDHDNDDDGDHDSDDGDHDNDDGNLHDEDNEEYEQQQASDSNGGGDDDDDVDDVGVAGAEKPVSEDYIEDEDVDWY
eukprot:jgi/Chrzof1/2512/Cz11g18110.t1